MAESTTESIIVPFESADISFFFYLWAIPVIVGIPGNILAVAVATRRHNRKLSPCVYMAAMGVADTLLLMERVMAIVLNEVLLKYGIITEPLWWFRALVYVIYSSSILSSLFLAAMSVDRLIAVRFPLDARRICTTSRAKVTVIVMTASISILNGHIFYVLQYFKDGELGVYASVFKVSGYDFAAILVTSFHTIVGTVLPFMVILICNILIIFTLRQAHVERKAMRGDQDKDSSSRHLTRMLLFVSFAYVIMTLPYRLHHLLMKIPDIAERFDLSVLYWRKQYIVITWSLLIVWLCNFSVNFYLYCVGGGRKYRNDAKQVIRSILPGI